MPRCVAKLAEDTYVEWSTIVDAPVTYTMTREQMLSYLDRKDGERSYDENRQRLNRTDLTGTSFHDATSLKNLISGNRAGEKETRITLEEIIERYHPKNAAANGDG